MALSVSWDTTRWALASSPRPMAPVSPTWPERSAGDNLICGDRGSFGAGLHIWAVRSVKYIERRESPLGCTNHPEQKNERPIQG